MPSSSSDLRDAPNRISRVIGRSWDLDPSEISTKVCCVERVPSPCAHGSAGLRTAGTYLSIDVAIKEALPSTEYDVAKYFERE